MDEEKIKDIIEIERIVQNLNNEHKYEEKIEYCLKGLNIDPNNNYLLSNLGFYYYKTLGDYKNAISYFRKAIENGDILPAVKKAYFYCLIELDVMPDEFDIKLLKEQFGRNGNYADYHAVLLERIFERCNTIDPDLISFYLINAVNHMKKYDNLPEKCDKLVDLLGSDSKSLKALEYAILAMRVLKNYDKYKEYANLFEKKVYDEPEHLNETRLKKISSYHIFLEKHKYIRL